jgi:GNAT superfamily N-acetyltransferase
MPHVLGDKSVAVVRLADLGQEDFTRCYDELLVPAFPPAELMSREALDDERHDPGTGGVVLQQDGAPVAAMVTEDYLGGRVRLLAYLVVAERLRGARLGTYLLSRLAEESADAHAVLAEIEDPRYHPVTATNDPVSRVRFYHRHGCRLLPVPYAQPALREGSPRVENLLLIAVAPHAPELDGNVVADFLDEYFAACEGPRVLTEDPQVRAIREAARGAPGGRLRLVSLDGLRAARPDPAGDVGAP